LVEVRESRTPCPINLVVFRDTTVPSFRLGPALLVVFPTVSQHDAVGST
jgi:hypothetical protein